MGTSADLSTEQFRRHQEGGMASETSTLHERHANPYQRTMPSSDSLRDVEKEAAVPRDSSENHEQEEPSSTEPSDDKSEAVAPSPPAGNPWLNPASFPDGGLQAWLVVAGGFCSLFVSFGWVNCIGVFQTYYETHQLAGYNPSTVAWIPSLETFFMFFGGLWVGRLYDNYGPRYILLVGTFLHVFGLMMTSISTKYYQFILAQSICSATGASMIFFSSMNAVVSWFFQKRALALGIAAAGSSLGGVIFPIMVEKLVREVGFGWTMRICSFLILGLMVIANLTIKSRIPPHPRPVKVMDFISPLTELPFALLAIGCFTFFLGLFLPFTFIILEGLERGVSPSLAPYLVSILNAASVFGRTLPGYAADKLGRFTVFVSMAILTAVITLALWLPGYGDAAVVTFAVIFGFSSGCIVSLAPTLVANLSDVTQIGVRTGTNFSFVAIAVLIGSPIGGQLIIADNGGYAKLQIFSGVMMCVGSACFAALRVRVGGWSLKKKV